MFQNLYVNCSYMNQCFKNSPTWLCF